MNSIFFYFPTINSPQKYLNVEDLRVGTTVREYKFESKQPFNKIQVPQFVPKIPELGYRDRRIPGTKCPALLDESASVLSERTYLKRLGEELVEEDI